MPIPVRLRRSATPGATPASLLDGEVAINVADGLLFWKDSAEVVRSTSLAQSGGGGATAKDVRFDGSGGTSYIGTASAGTATSASSWKIKRTIVAADGSVSSSLTANSVKWDDRLTATYL